MALHIALLRGINVGGQKKVSMSDLRDFCVALGFEDVRTLLQSGNVVFRTRSQKPAELEALLEKRAAERLGLETSFLVRTAPQWRKVVSANPFEKEAKRDPSHLLVTFLKTKPKAKAVKELEEAVVGSEYLRVIGREAYIVYPDGVGRSRLTNAVIERKLGTVATARNWNTVAKLEALTLV